MKRLLSLLLVIAMLFGICTMFAACDSTSSVSDDEDDGKKKDVDEDDDVEPTLVLKGLKIVLPEDFELESQDESEGDNSAQAFFEGDSYSVAVSCGPLSGDMEGMSAKELRDYILEQLDPEDEDSEVGEYDTGSKNKTPYFYAVKDDETAAIVGAFYVDDEYAWQVRIMTNEDSEDFSVEEMIELVTGWKYEAPKAEDEDEDNWDEDNEDDRDEDDEHPEQNATQPTEGTTPEPSEPEEPENVKYLLMSSVRTYFKSETDIVITETVYSYDYNGYLTMITETVNGATETTTVTCDAYGNPCVLVDNEVTETRTYNAQNQLIYSYFSDGKEITYTYDENGWLIKEETVSPNGGHYIAYTYDENGLKLTAATYDQYGCALSSRFTYDDAGRVIRIDYRSNGLNSYELYTYEDTSDGYMKIATQYNHLDKVEVTQVYTYVKVPQ